ncbi:MAG: hypothetical protein WCK86_10440 [Planctomycetia bacterium]
MARHAGLFLWIAVWLAVARFCGLLLPLQSEVVVPSHASPLHDHVDRHVRADEPDDLMRTASLPGAVDSAVRMLQPSSLLRGRQTNFGGTSRLDGTIREDGRIQHWKQTGQHRERPGAAAGNARGRMPEFRKVLVAPHALVVVLSLDLSGAAHRFQYSSVQQLGRQSSRGESQELKTVGLPGNGAEFCEQAVIRNLATAHDESFLLHDWGHHTADTSFVEAETSADRRIDQVIRPVSIAGSFRTSPIHTVGKLPRPVDGGLVKGGQGWEANARRRSVRCFRMPRFSAGQSREVLCEGHEFLRTEGVSVFLDSSLPEAEFDAEEIRGAGSRIAALCDGGLRRSVELLVGPIRDVDGDGQLSVVLTRLEPDQSSGNIPVRGCVRESDFLDASSGPPGDIIYLDIAVPEAAELAGLLAHEMTHAAMYSRLLDRREKGLSQLSLPGWFHEAVAHWTEHQLAGRGLVFAERLRMYQRNPAAAPVCPNPLWMSYTASRGGPRIAGSRFLEVMLRPEASLAGIMCEARNVDEILEQCLGTSLSEALVPWSRYEAARLFREAPERIPLMRSDEAGTQRIYGTAFLVLQCGAKPLVLEIGCEDTSDWNLTVIER